jgi:hypothetical protein
MFILSLSPRVSVPAIDPWAREVSITTLYVLATACAYTHLVYLFWPTRVARYFSVSSHMQRFEFDSSAAAAASSSAGEGSAVYSTGYANL